MHEPGVGGRVGGVIGGRKVSENANTSRPSGSATDQVESPPVQPRPASTYRVRSRFKPNSGGAPKCYVDE